MVKYVEKVKAFIDKPLDKLELEDIREIRKKVKFPCKIGYFSVLPINWKVAT